MNKTVTEKEAMGKKVFRELEELSLLLGSDPEIIDSMTIEEIKLELHEMGLDPSLRLTDGKTRFGGIVDRRAIGRHLEHFTVTTDALCGRVLNGRYKLIEALGKGAIGTVYRANRMVVDDMVAVKVLHTTYTKDTKLIEQFCPDGQVLDQQNCPNEVLIKSLCHKAAIAANSRDPRIVKIYDAGETSDGIIYFVMEFIAAPTMRTVLQREERFSLDRAVELMIEICDGIDAVHRQSIVHRDVKPENIMILPPTEERDHESVVLVDFGLAKPLNLTPDQVLTQPGTMLGSLFYMAPEQLRGEEVDVRADIYSLGAVLYELLTGKPPFSGMSAAEVIAKHILEDPPPLPAYLKSKRKLESVIMRALAKDPNERYRTAKELAAALRATLPTSVIAPKHKRWLDILTHLR